MTDSDYSGGLRVPIALIRDVAVATAQEHLEEYVVAAFREDILELLSDNRLRAVVIDLSNVSYLDGGEFEALRATIRTIELMGARSVIVGIRPAIAASLVTLEADTRGIVTALTLERAFEILAPAEAAVHSDIEGVDVHEPDGDNALDRIIEP